MMTEFQPGDRVVDATDDDDNLAQMHGTVVGRYVPGEDEDPGFSVWWDGMPAPLDELENDLAPEVRR
jgi:hypothetical protein